MSRKCPECKESGRAHLPTCSYAPDTEERNAFIREHAVEMVRTLEAKVRRQAKEIEKLTGMVTMYKKRAGMWAATAANLPPDTEPG